MVEIRWTPQAADDLEAITNLLLWIPHTMPGYLQEMCCQPLIV